MEISCGAFIENIDIIKNTDKPKYIYIFRIVSRNTIVMLHNLIIPLLIAFYFGYLSIYIFTLIPVIAITVLLLCLISFPMGVISTRYRDFIPFTQNILQLFFFLTPIFWVAGTETARFTFLHLNPFDYILTLLRMPFYGSYNSLTLIIIILFMLIFYFIALILFKKF